MILKNFRTKKEIEYFLNSRLEWKEREIRHGLIWKVARMVSLVPIIPMVAIMEIIRKTRKFREYNKKIKECIAELGNCVNEETGWEI